jgi:hypothetical protein
MELSGIIVNFNVRDFLNIHTDPRALGIRMINGEGRFLPETFLRSGCLVYEKINFKLPVPDPRFEGQAFPQE